jgi:ATP-dependent Clp protease ATP-binding subunit ClpC
VRSRGSRSTVNGGGTDTFERFTERARQVVVLAQEEARALGHGSIGTEHLLLGLVREGEGIGANVLSSLGVTLEGVRAAVVARVGRGAGGQTGQIPFTPDAKKTLELSLRQALSFKHNYIGTEHILLGLAQADPATLDGAGVSGGAVRDEVLRQLGGAAAGVGWEHELEALPPDASVDARLDALRAEGWEIVSVRVERRRKR